MPSTNLKRGLGVTLLTLYGVGVTVGAGIYVLVGKVSGEAGLYGPAAFLVAAFVAGLTALSYSELAARFPVSAGEAIYVNEAFGTRFLATGIGLMVAATGFISASVITLGFVGYLNTLVASPHALTVVIVVAVLAGLAVWGITESVFLSGLITVAEVAGLALVIGGGLDDMVASPILTEALFPPLDGAVWGGIMAGALLAFFAFIGFEDMVNVAEEVIDPVRTIPRSIVATLAVTTLIYILVSAIAVTTVPVGDLIDSPAPLALVFERTTGWNAEILSGIAILAVLNGALIQIIMGSRILYGLAKQGWLPAFLASVHAGRRTPVAATAVVAGIILVLALAFPLVTLAEATSYITLTVFAVVNVALIRLRLGGAAAPVRIVPLWVPVIGGAACTGMVLFNVAQVLN